jgi:hypothetical protein
MLGILFSIIVASRVKTLKRALIMGFILPVMFGIASLSLGGVVEPNPAGLLLSIPLSIFASYLTFKKCEKKRLSGVQKTRKEKVISYVGIIIVAGMLAYLGYLIWPMIKLNLGV